MCTHVMRTAAKVWKKVAARASREEKPDPMRVNERSPERRAMQAKKSAIR